MVQEQRFGRLGKLVNDMSLMSKNNSVMYRVTLYYLKSIYM